MSQTSERCGKSSRSKGLKGWRTQTVPELREYAKDLLSASSSSSSALRTDHLPKLSDQKRRDQLCWFIEQLIGSTRGGGSSSSSSSSSRNGGGRQSRQRRYEFVPIIEEIETMEKYSLDQLHGATSRAFQVEVADRIAGNRYANGKKISKTLDIIEEDDPVVVDYEFLPSGRVSVAYNKKLNSINKEHMQDVFGGEAFGDTYAEGYYPIGTFNGEREFQLFLVRPENVHFFI
jgi:hypothetical protein